MATQILVNLPVKDLDGHILDPIHVKPGAGGQS
jgi:hypothetical protein